VVQEFSPGADKESLWTRFCGHIYLLASLLHDLDTGIGNPGIRAILAGGELFQIREPESWHKVPWRDQTRNWFILTSASVALLKCKEAEDAGRRGGFVSGLCWHESGAEPRRFLGSGFQWTPEAALSNDYEAIHAQTVSAHTAVATLPTS
jgi:hypothetical protein